MDDTVKCFLNFPGNEDPEIETLESRFIPIVGDVIEWGGGLKDAAYRVVRRQWLYGGEGDPTLHIQCEIVSNIMLNRNLPWDESAHKRVFG